MVRRTGIEPVRDLVPADFKSAASACSATLANIIFLEAAPRFELGSKGFADLCLTTWLCRLNMERKTRFELATLALARRCSTAELFPHIVLRRFSQRHLLLYIRLSILSTHFLLLVYSTPLLIICILCNNPCKKEA